MTKSKILFIVLLITATFCRIADAGEFGDGIRVEALKQEDLGNDKDAAELFQGLALSPENTPRAAARDLWNAWRLFRKTWDTKSQSALLDAAETAWPDGWRISMAVIALRARVKYTENMRLETGLNWWNLGESQQEREYWRSLALWKLRQLEKKLADPRDPASPGEITDFYMLFSMLMNAGYRVGGGLAELTDIEKMPERDTFAPFVAGRSSGAFAGAGGASVDADGAPMLYRVPSSWESAVNDGERWRWLLERMADSGGKEWRDQADWMLARFFNRTLGVVTMVEHFRWSPPSMNVESGPFAIETLSDNETIALLTTGLKRLLLPDEFNPILIFRRLCQEATDPGIRLGAFKALADIYETRLQYPKAAAMWKEALSLLPEGEERERVQASLDRIIDNNGELESPNSSLPAGARPRLSYLFRNGERVGMTAYRLDEQLLLADIRAELGAEPAGDEQNDVPVSEILHRKVVYDPTDLGKLVVEYGATRYIAEKTAEWDVQLEPPSDHRSRRVSLEMPFSLAGCYLVEAAMTDGNTSRVVLWLNELALLRSKSDNGNAFRVVDAISGQPVAGADVSFLGYVPENETTWRYGEFLRQTDDDGLAFFGEQDFRGAGLSNKRSYTFFGTVTAKASDGRFCYLAFREYTYGSDREPEEKTLPPNTAAFIIIDRPAYRPGQDIHFNVWLGQQMESEKYSDSYLSDLPLAVRITGPGSRVVYEKSVVTDAHGGFADTISLSDAMPLGEYTIKVFDVRKLKDAYVYPEDTLKFRLEEYRKPEFEVMVETPRSAVALGDSVVVETKARYHYGSPVVNASVRYKVLRTSMRGIAFPALDWNWLYRPESWWHAGTFSWYPGWKKWGIQRPQPPRAKEYWLNDDNDKFWREVVAEGEGTLGEDGVFRFVLDTAPAKGLLPDGDHTYEISVEVTDMSRRTAVGSGEIAATQRSYNVFVLPDRELYAPEQEMRFRIASIRRQGGSVQTKGTATLYALSYDSERIPTEKAVTSANLTTNADGDAWISFPAGAAGQYRLSCEMEDKDGRQAEGAVILTVFGQPGEGDFRFAELDLIPDKAHYRVGDTMRLAVVSSHPSIFALLSGGPDKKGHQGEGGGKPLPLQLENHVAMVDIPVTASDAPGFVINAVAVVDGVEISSNRNIPVPPIDKLLSVELKTDKTEYAPGEKARIAVRVVDADGEPAAVECVVAVYDKAVDAFAGGAGVDDIRAYFWKDIWHRSGYVPRGSSLRHGYRTIRKDDVEWMPIGPFGRAEAKWRYDGAERQRLDYVSPMYSMASQEEIDAPFKMAKPGLRSNFADTALWMTQLETDDQGKADCSFTMPENLTAWRARVWVMGPGTHVGSAETTATTRKNVIIRPQTPRFLTQKDRATLSANLHNYLPNAKTARVELVLDGDVLQAVEDGDPTRMVELAANGEARVGWEVNARQAGEAGVVMRLLTDEESDAVETRLPVIVHGARKVEAFGGVIVGDGEAAAAVRVPEERQPDASRLMVSFSPTVASTILEALPYLQEYPYECTEQTLNRFLPAVVTRHCLDRLGLFSPKRSDMEKEPESHAPTTEWAMQFGRSDSGLEKSPVFDSQALAAQVRRGIEKLSTMQNHDSGWGWFSGTGEKSWPHNTALVVHGLMKARDCGADIPKELIRSGLDWLQAYRTVQLARLHAEQDDSVWANLMGDSNHLTGSMAWEIRIGTRTGSGKEFVDDIDAFVHMVLTEDGDSSAEMRETLFRDRKRLSLSGLAMLGLALHADGATDELDIVLQNLSQYIEEDAATGTARLRTPARSWMWYNDPIETQAWYLKLLARTDPKGDRTARIAHYLIRHRRNGGYWRSTRDTAYAIEALAEYAAASEETVAGTTVAMYLDGDKVMERTISPEDALADNRFILEGVDVTMGEHELKIVSSGSGTIYYGGALSVFSTEDPIAEAGGELKVTRAYYRLTPEKTGKTGAGAVAHAAGYRGKRIPSPFERNAEAETTLEPGDLLEVELTVESDDDYEYLVFEDMKPAGCEPLEMHSGYNGNNLGAYVEYRDQKVVFFVRFLSRGKRVLRYRLRAETPGAFSALPFVGGGMYAPDLFANSEEMKVRIVEETASKDD